LHKIAETGQMGIRASPNIWKKAITSVPADDDANLRAGRPQSRRTRSRQKERVRALVGLFTFPE
jgi:hypothetical protein